MAKKEQDELIEHDYDGIQEYDNDLPGWWKALFLITIIFGIGYLLYYHVLGIGDLSRTEYMKELNPHYSKDLAQASGGLISPYHSPFFANDENLTPRVKMELEKIADATFDQALMRAMSKADDAQMAKLKGAFPEIYNRYVTGGPVSAPGAKGAEEPVIAAPLKDAASLADGKAVYEKNCVQCHGKGGEGIIGPNLTDDYWIHGGTISDVVKTIRAGVPDKGMITWKGLLTNDQIDHVGSFIMVKLQGTHPPNPKGPQGEKVVAAK